MSIRDRVRKLREAAPKQRVRVTFDHTGHIQWPGETPKAKPAAPQEKRKVLSFKIEELRPGGKCPKCGGRKKYTYLDGRIGKCNICDSRGFIIPNDIAEVFRRLDSGATIGWIKTREDQPAFC